MSDDARSVTEQLERLAALRERGALTEDEFQNQKQAVLAGSGKAKRKKRWWPRLLLGIAGLVGLAVAIIDAATPDTAPECNSSAAESYVKDAVANAPSSRVLNLQLLSLASQEQISFDEASGERRCRATAAFNTGIQKITYRFFKQAKDASYLVEVNP